MIKKDRKSKSLHFRTTEKLYEKIQTEIDKTGISVSSLLCMAVSEYFEKQEKEEKK